MKEQHVFVNDHFERMEQAFVHVSDLAVQRGYGIFDYFKVVHSSPIFLEDHLDRFFYSAGQMRLPLPYDRQQLRIIIDQLMEKNQQENAGIKLTLTGGNSRDGYTIERPTLIITQQPMIVPENDIPIRLVTFEHQRQMPEVKTIDYLMAIWLRPFIAANNANEVLYKSNGFVSEIPRANFFIVDQDNKIVTADSKILKGVIRKNLLSLRNFAVVERPVALDEVYHAKEAFITSTTRNLTTVSHVDGREIGNGIAGPITFALLDALKKRFN